MRPTVSVPHRLGRAAGIVALAAFVVWLVYRPDRVDLAGVLPVDRGDPAFLLWTLAWGAHALTTSPGTVFSAPIFHPNPLTFAYSDPMLAVAPFFWAIAGLTGSNTTAVNVTLLLLAAGNVVATYVFVRWLTDSTAAGVAAGIAFGASGWLLANAGHVQLQVALLIPLCFWLLGRVLVRGSVESGFWLAVVQVALVASSLYLGLAWVIGAATVVLGWLIATRLQVVRGTWRALVVAVGGAGVALIPVVWPYAQLQSGAGQFRRPLTSMIPLRPPDLFRLPWGGGTIDRALFGSAGRTPQFLPESTWWPGLVVALLAGAGVVVLCRRREAALVFRYDDASLRRRYARLCLVAGAVGTVLALGPTLAGLPMPFRVLWAWVPGFAGVRVPARFAVLAVVATAVAVGVAVAAAQVVVERAVAGRRFRTAAAKAATEASEQGLAPMAPSVGRPVAATVGVAVTVVALLLVEVWGVQVPWVPFPDDPARLAATHELAGLGPGAVVELPMAVPDSPEFAPLEAPRQADATHDSAWHPRVNGYSGFTPATYRDDVAVLNTYPAPAALDRMRALGVRYVLVHASLDAPATLVRLP